MNNLSEKQQNAKQAFLEAQQNKMLSIYKDADRNERAAIFRQIDGFLPTLTPDEKRFWLSFRQRLERIGETETTRGFLARIGVRPKGERVRELLIDYWHQFAVLSPEQQAADLEDFRQFANRSKPCVKAFMLDLADAFEKAGGAK